MTSEEEKAYLARQGFWAGILLVAVGALIYLAIKIWVY